MVGTGVAVGVVAVPIRFMHTASEVAQFSDVAAAIDLVEAFVRALPLDASFLR
jgi:putative aminopeptidase FrvX